MPTDLRNRSAAGADDVQAAGPPATPWDRLADQLAAGIAASPASEPRTGPTIDTAPHVAALGVRDELSDAGGVPAAGVPVHVYGSQVVVGPAPRPHRASPCSRCLARRWQSVRFPALRDALEVDPTAPRGVAGPPPPAFAVDQAAALVAYIAAAGEDRPDAGSASVFSLDLDRLEVRRHQLLADPECPACRPGGGATGAVSAAHPAVGRRLVLRPAPKPFSTTFRVRDLGDLELDQQALVNPVCGALGPTVVTDLTSTSTAAVSGGFSTRSGSYLRETLWGGHADGYAESLRIGLLEGLERYAGIRPRGGTPTLTASLDDLAGWDVAALDPRSCGVYSDDFYRAHPEVLRFRTDRPLGWVPGYSLRDHRTVLVPEVLAHYQARTRRERFVQSSSSGCATGGCLEEAAYHGLMEAVERDAFLLSWYGGIALPEIDVSTSRRARTRHMVDRLAMLGYEARFFDTRIGFPIPVVTAVAVRRGGGLGALCVGAGSSLDPEAAIASALDEIATDSVQLRARTLRDEARLRAMTRDFGLVAELHDHPLSYGIPEMARHADFLVGRPGEPRPPALPLSAVYAADRPAPPVSDDLTEDLRWCVDVVAAAGFDVLVVDQTLPEQRALGLATVNVIVPGLLPIDFGWERQRALRMPRLRTALRQAGLVDHDLHEQDLHRVPHPFP